jgi:hypothetical protein
MIHRADSRSFAVLTMTERSDGGCDVSGHARTVTGSGVPGSTRTEPEESCS